MVISIDTENTFDKLQCCFMIKKKKTLHKVGIEGNYLKEGKYDKLLAHIILNDEKLKAYPLRSGTK